MKISPTSKQLIYVFALAAAGGKVIACSSSDSTNPENAVTSSTAATSSSATSSTAGAGGSGGAATGSGGTGGATTGSGGTGGATTGSGGTGGAATGSGGTGGAATGTGGAATGSGGTGGAATGTGGVGGGGGQTSAAGGGGGAGPTSKLLYDFETATETPAWVPDAGVTTAISTIQHFTGAQSLKVTVPTLTAKNVAVSVPAPAFYPGTVLTLHVWSPAGAGDGLYVQGYSQYNNYKGFDPGTTNGNGPQTLTRGGWTTWTYTIPNTFPGGIENFGIQFGSSGATPFAGGDFYIDSITAVEGAAVCTGVATASYGFETAGDVSAWTLGGNPATPDTAISQSTTEALAGTNSLQVAFTALPGGTPAAPTTRQVFISGPNLYCTDVVTVNVWLPTGSDAVTFQVFTQFNAYAGYDGKIPATITRNGWTKYVYTIPANVGPQGIEAFGIQFNNTGAAPFTGNAYIDSVSW